MGVKELGAGLSWLWNRRTEKGNEGSCFQGRHVQVLASLASGPSVTMILLLCVPRHTGTCIMNGRRS